jgi:predicted nucleotidyltransferase
MKLQIGIPKAWLEGFFEKNHIVKMSLFGSVLSDQFKETSDIDILIEFEPKHVPGLFGFVRMRDALSRRFGRKVDLRTPEDISTLFRNEVIQQSYPIYGKKRFKSA